MTNNPTIDGVLVPRELIDRILNRTRWHGDPLKEELRALIDSPAVDKTNELREHCKQCAEVVKTWPEWKRDCLGGAPSVERQELVQMASMPVERCYDVRAKMIIAFNEAKKAGGDLDDALDAAYRSALRFSPAPQDFDALQSTIARLEAQIAELESGRAVVEVQHGPFDDVGAPQWVRVVALGDYDLEHIPDGTKLYTAPPAPVVVVLPERQSENEGNSYSVMQAMAWNACLDATAALNGPAK